eukprot:TRINITY_DN27101_c0_g1_i1.p1 TRINITY_DN27101_c0_g1~~TRINITY_DN27101_c0_g1_i1.p1  ORF type:complete len:671 (+),score=137.26 TRINITY_DN27101_c0_g1_i1:85-2097(+)
MNKCKTCSFCATDLAPGHCCQGCRNGKAHDTRCPRLMSAGHCYVEHDGAVFGVFKLWRGKEHAVFGLLYQAGQPHKYLKVCKEKGLCVHKNHKAVPHKDCWISVSSAGEGKGHFLKSTLHGKMLCMKGDKMVLCDPAAKEHHPWSIRMLSEAEVAASPMKSNHISGRRLCNVGRYIKPCDAAQLTAKGYLVVRDGVSVRCLDPIVARVNHSLLQPETIKVSGVWGGQIDKQFTKHALFRSSVWPCVASVTEQPNPTTVTHRVVVEMPLEKQAEPQGYPTDSEAYDSEEENAMVAEKGPSDAEIVGAVRSEEQHEDEEEEEECREATTHTDPNADHVTVQVVLALDRYPLRIAGDEFTIQKGDYLIARSDCEVGRASNLCDGGVVGMTVRYSVQCKRLVACAESITEEKELVRVVERPLYTADTLTVEMKRAFVEDGYVLVPNAVPDEFITTALRAINNVLFDKKTIFRHKDGRADSCMGLLFRSPEVTDTLYRTNAWKVVKNLLGQALKNKGCQIAFRGPSPPHLGMTAPEDIGPKWHVDGHAKLGNHTPFSLLVGVALSTTSTRNNGNLCVWPGGHKKLLPHLKKRHQAKQLYLKTLPDVGHGRQVRANRGDLLICHQKLPHQYSPNLGPDIRHMLYFRIKAAGMKAKVPSGVHLEDLWVDFPGLADVL